MKKILIITLSLMMAGCASTGVQQDQSMSELYMKAEAAYAQKQYTVAKQHYQAVADKYPDNVGALFKLANISMREKEWDKAMDYYTVILKLKPRHAKAHHNLAMLHLNKARAHLNYYIAHNDSMNNKPMGELIEAINAYSSHKPEQQTSLDRLADIVKH
jgi:tetratricopeptide (TPR) repeat protein